MIKIVILYVGFLHIAPIMGALKHAKCTFLKEHRYIVLLDNDTQIIAQLIEWNTQKARVQWVNGQQFDIPLQSLLKQFD